MSAAHGNPSFYNFARKNDESQGPGAIMLSHAFFYLVSLNSAEAAYDFFDSGSRPGDR